MLIQLDDEAISALTKQHWQANSHRPLLRRHHVIAIAKRRATVKREATEMALIQGVKHPVTHTEVFTLTDLLLQPLHAGHLLSWQKLPQIVTKCCGCCSTGRLSTDPPRAWSRARDSCIRPGVHRTTGLERRSRVQACRQPRALQNRAPGPHWNNSRRRQSQPHQYLPKPLTSIESSTALEAREVDSLWSRWLCGHGLEYRAIGQCPSVHSFLSHQGLVRSFGCRHRR